MLFAKLCSHFGLNPNSPQPKYLFMQKFNRHFQFKPLSFSIIVIPTSANNIFNFYFEKYFPNPNMSFTNHFS